MKSVLKELRGILGFLYLVRPGITKEGPTESEYRRLQKLSRKRLRRIIKTMESDQKTKVRR